MPGLNLKSMGVDALLELRSKVDSQLASRSSDLQKQLARLGGSTVVHRKGRGSVLKGVKVKPKYRNAKTGETWAGRGVLPRWLRAALKSGKMLDSFLIDKTARKIR
jgi:DNA-binding protein H-NS